MTAREREYAAPFVRRLSTPRLSERSDSRFVFHDAKGVIMKRALLITTAICGFYGAIGMADAQAGKITTTTTTVWTSDFPDSKATTTTFTETAEDCDDCIFLVTFNFGKGRRIKLQEGTVLAQEGQNSHVLDKIIEIGGNKDGINQAYVDRILGAKQTGQTTTDPKTGCMYIRGHSCLEYNTLVLMSDGSTKKIGEIVAGDETAYGIVHQTFIRRFDQSRTMEADFQASYNGGLYNYRGVLVTGNHAVRDGDRWMQVADTRDAVPASFDETATVGNVYNLDIEGGVIPVVNPDGELIAFLDDKQAFALHHLAA